MSEYPSSPSEASRHVSGAVSRRDAVAALGAVWITGALACAKDAAKTASTADSATTGTSGNDGHMAADVQPPQTLTHFSAAQGADVEAMMARIIPSDDGPGAKEAGSVYFFDKGLTTFAKDQAKMVDEGLVQLSKSVAKAHGGETRFSALTPEQQDAMLRTIEKTPLFGITRFATIAGFLSLPKYGGNRDFAGWKYIGQEHSAEQKPPFGWYDKPENQMALLGRTL